MIDEVSKSADQPESVQDSAVSTQANEGATEVSSQRPSDRDIASVRTALGQKKVRLSNRKSQLGSIQATLKRGYHKIKDDDRKTPIIVEIDAAEREYLKAKAGALRIEIFTVRGEIKDYTQVLRSLSSRAKSANSRDLKTLQENARMKKVSNQVVAKVKDVVTKDTVSQYPTLASFTKGSSVNDLQDLETFFSVNLASEFKKFSTSPKLTARIYDRTIKHIQKISQ